MVTKFDQVLADIRALHDKKQADYGKSHDPFANVRASEEFGIPGWVGAMIRANDKMRRLQAAARGQNLRNESVEVMTPPPLVLPKSTGLPGAVNRIFPPFATQARVLYVSIAEPATPTGISATVA